MKKYSVDIPITGILYVEVEAENKEKAKEKAMEFNYTQADIVAWETHEQVTQGNVFHGMLNEIEVDEIE